MKMKLTVLLACLFVSIGFVTARTLTVSGVVTGEEDGEPIVGASVLVKGTSLGAVTNIDGKFSITNVPNSAKTLVISFIGMQTQEIDIKPMVKVILRTDTEVLDEVVVTAMGITRDKKALGYAATSVKGDVISQSKAVNPMNALQGKSCRNRHIDRTRSGCHTERNYSRYVFFRKQPASVCR